MSARARGSSDERGFVLVVVLFVMAALTVTVSGALLITQTEEATARASVDANRAFHVAQAGLMYFVTDRSALRNDSTVYEIAGGRVVVRSRRVAIVGLEEIHEISARATIRTGASHSEVREVRQLAVLELRPITPVAALATTARNITAAGVYSGTDVSSSGACAAAARGSVGGIGYVAGGSANLGMANTQGNPRVSADADTAAMRARMSAEWEELVDPRMSYDYEVPANAWPNFSMLALSAYPTIRVRGPFAATAARSGRGLLVVDGPLNLGADFQWDGLIVAASFAHPIATNAQIRGAIMSGLSTDATGTISLGYTSAGSLRIYYDACKVFNSQQRIPRMRLMANTWSEPV